MALLAPSILSADFSDLKNQIRCVEIGKADLIHCDVMDGVFVPNITFGPIVVTAVNKITQLPLDVHLMIKNPDNYLGSFVQAGADYLTVHQEEVLHLNRTLNQIKKLGAKAGVAINPFTSLSNLNESFEFLDLLLVMSVNPGFGGQKLIKEVLKKISQAKKIRDEGDFKFLIEVDGGINAENITECLEAGADIIVAGASVFKSPNPTAATLELKNKIVDFISRKEKV